MNWLFLFNSVPLIKGFSNRYIHSPRKIPICRYDSITPGKAFLLKTGLDCCFQPRKWRRGWDSNPCALSRKLISSQPRYDLFDTSPYLIFVRTLIGNCKAPFLFPASQSRENRRKTELLRENRSFRAVPSDETEPLSSQGRYDHFDTYPNICRHRRL